MASLLIKNVPPQIHAALKQRAANHRRSLNSETIHILEQVVGGAAPSADVERDIDEETISTLPTEIAQRVRSAMELRRSLAARQVDFNAWSEAARESRR